MSVLVLVQFEGGSNLMYCNFFVLYVGGGEMISDVFLDHSTFADPPSRLVDFFTL